MLKKLIHISNQNSDNVTFDWVVLAAGIVSLGMAVTLTATHNANAASQTASAQIVAELTTQ